MGRCLGCSRTRALAFLVTLLTVVIPAPGSAQEPAPEVARSFAQLGTRVEPGTEVSVVDTAGKEITGDLANISASFLTLSIDGTPVNLDEADVVRVSRPAYGLSRIWGGLIGFGAGLGVVAGVSLVAIAASDNQGSSLDSSTGNAIAWGVMLGGATLGAVKIRCFRNQLLAPSL